MSNDVISDTLKFARDSQSIIENATVYSECLFNDGRRYRMRYFGSNKELVEKYAKKRLEEIDPYRSPSLSNNGIAQLCDDGYEMMLQYYGLD